jgi:hypothetical protein
MYKVILIFRDTDKMASFLINEKMSGVEVNTSESALSGILSKDQIDLACKSYGAYIRVFTEVES